MNNSELEKAYDEYEKLLDEKNYLEQDLADLGERKGNAPKEEFDKVKEKLNAIYDKIEKVGEKIAELSKDAFLVSLTFARQTSRDQDMIDTFEGLISKIAHITDDEWDSLKLKVPFYTYYDAERNVDEVPMDESM